MAELTYSVTEAAQALGISRRTMYEVIHQEGFPTLKVGGRRLISRELLAEWVKAIGEEFGVSADLLLDGLDQLGQFHDGEGLYFFNKFGDLLRSHYSYLLYDLVCDR